MTLMFFLLFKFSGNPASSQGVAAATVANSHLHHTGVPGAQHSDTSTAQVCQVFLLSCSTRARFIIALV